MKGIINKGEELKLIIFLDKHKDKLCQIKTSAGLQFAVFKQQKKIVAFNEPTISYDGIKWRINRSNNIQSHDYEVISFSKAFLKAKEAYISKKSLPTGVFVKLAALIKQSSPTLYNNLWSHFDYNKALEDWSKEIYKIKNTRDSKKSVERHKYLMEIPTAESIDSAVKGYLTKLVRPDIGKHLKDQKIVSELRVASWHNIMTKDFSRMDYNSDPKKMVELLRSSSVFYYNQLPIMDTEGFLRYCFHEWENPYHGSKLQTFYAKKFSMLIDNSFLTLGLLDEDEDIRDFAQFIKANE